MTPIEIEKSIITMSNEQLADKINFLSYTFCVNADFTKKEAINKLIDKLEMCLMEGVLRIVEDNIGYRPYQNKIYEQIENVFDNQDAYNINRMISSLRRTKLISIEFANEKYIAWMKNRIKYGIKTILQFMNKQNASAVTHN